MAAQELLLSEVTAEGPPFLVVRCNQVQQIFLYGTLKPHFSSNLEDLAFEIILAQLSS